MRPSHVITNFEDHLIRTFRHEGQHAWLLSEIEDVLGAVHDDFSARAFAPVADVDYATLSADEARRLRRRLADGRKVLPMEDTVLYPTGLALVCAHTAKGHALRRQLLEAVAHVARRDAIEAKLAREVGVPVENLWSAYFVKQASMATRRKRLSKTQRARA